MDNQNQQSELAQILSLFRSRMKELLSGKKKLIGSYQKKLEEKKMEKLKEEISNF